MFLFSIFEKIYHGLTDENIRAVLKIHCFTAKAQRKKLLKHNKSSPQQAAGYLSCQRTLASILWIPASAGMTTQVPKGSLCDVGVLDPIENKFEIKFCMTLIFLRLFPKNICVLFFN